MNPFFKCKICKKFRFKKNLIIIDGKPGCKKCYEEIKQKEAENIAKLTNRTIHEEKKRIRKEESRKLADIKLLESIKKENEKNKIKNINNKANKQKIETTKTKITNDKNLANDSKKIVLEKVAEKKARNTSSVIYVYADIKRIKVIEWLNGKKRIALNKEREIRHTHKGGWSQEKFQRFVDSKKDKAWDWIEDVLTRKGVLRPPYDEFFIESNDNILKHNLEKLLNEINS